MYVKFVKGILRDISEYSGMMGAIKHFFCDSEGGLKTGGKAKPQNKISLLIKRGEDIIAEFTDNTMNINGRWGSKELTSREAEGRGGKKTQHETLQNEVAHVHSIVSHPSEAQGCGEGLINFALSQLSSAARQFSAMTQAWIKFIWELYLYLIFY